MNLGRAWIKSVLSIVAIALSLTAAAQDELADFSPPPLCGDRLFANLSAEIDALEVATAQGDVPSDLYQMLMRHWQGEWEKEIRRCVTELYVQFGRLQRGWDPNDPAGSPLASEPPLMPPNSALPQRNGRGEREREKPPVAGSPTSPRSGANSSEEAYLRELVANTQARMRSKWAALMDRVSHGVERVD
ncbi:MAG: hypothetical protein IT288_05055 [Bdellovibrionales bacterium]|nr:hypothetical protein [Bdellovibrionales bacterium]